MIAVGNSTISDGIRFTSSHGDHIDISAPGTGILSTDINGQYLVRTGTSMAAPFVSGVASLLTGYDPNLDNDDIENIIKLSADEVDV